MNTGSRLNKKDTVLSWAFLLPLFLVLLIFMCYPFINGFLLSVKNEKGDYIGFSHFSSLLGGSRFGENITRTIIYVFVTVIGAIILGLLAAHLINKK